jgi:hypothetical protein
MSIFKSQTVTLLAREITFDSANTSTPIIIEGDRKGVIIWILKKLGLIDPSYRVEVKNGNLITCAGKSQYTYLPLSLLSSYSAGFAKKKLYVVVAILFCICSFILLMMIMWHGFESEPFLVTIILGLLGGLFFWLYKRSGVFNFKMSLYNGEGAVTIRLKSGLTGASLDADIIQKALDATATAAKSSQYFK